MCVNVDWRSDMLRSESIGHQCLLKRSYHASDICINICIYTYIYIYIYMYIYTYTSIVCANTDRRSDLLRSESMGQQCLFPRPPILRVHHFRRGRHMVIHTRALYIRKRALHIRKRALQSLSNSQMESLATRTAYCNEPKNPVYPQKTTTYPQKSPVYPQKSPVYPQKSSLKVASDGRSMCNIFVMHVCDR